MTWLIGPVGSVSRDHLCFCTSLRVVHKPVNSDGWLNASIDPGRPSLACGLTAVATTLPNATGGHLVSLHPNERLYGRALVLKRDRTATKTSLSIGQRP